MRKFLLLSVMLTLMAAHSWAQRRTVTGKVTDEKNVAIPSANVQIKNTNSGTVTNEDGMFSIKVPPEAKVLVFSAAGMATQEVSIGSQDVINVSLNMLDRSMQEVSCSDCIWHQER